MSGWEITGWAALTVVGLIVVAAAISTVLVLTLGRGEPQREVPSTNPVVEDRLWFTSPEVRDAFEAAFWETVAPIRKFPTPVVPGDGGESRWTS